MAKGVARKSAPTPPPGALDQWVASLGFWLFSTLAVGLCGAVLVLPRLHQQRRLVHKAKALRGELRLLHDGNRRMAHEADALRDDPFYIGETARRELGYRNPAEKRIRVTSLCSRTRRVRPVRHDPLPWLTWLERLYARDEPTRRASLCVATVLLLTASIAFCRKGW